MENDNKSNNGREVTVRTPANIQAVKEHLQQSPRKPQQVSISRETVQTVIHTNVNCISIYRANPPETNWYE